MTMTKNEFDFQKISQDMLRALRGIESQAAFSKRMGYVSNVSYTWEAGKRFPLATEVMRIVHESKPNFFELLNRFEPELLRDFSQDVLLKPDFPATLFRLIRRDESVSEIAIKSRQSRFSVRRYLSGESQPRLPEFLALVHALSDRLFDFMAVLLPEDATILQSETWTQAESVRKAARAHPITQAIWASLTTTDYLALTEHDSQWIADFFGIPLEMTEEALKILANSGAIEWTGSHWSVLVECYVNTSGDVDNFCAQAQFWGERGVAEIAPSNSDTFFYLVLGVSYEDMPKLRALQRKFFKDITKLAGNSEPCETIAVANYQMFDLRDSKKG